MVVMCCLLFHEELDCHAIRWLNNGHKCDMGLNIACAALNSHSGPWAPRGC